MTNIPLSVVIIASNEEDVISDAINSCRAFAKEIIVIVGNDITDSTIKIAEKLEARILKHQFKDFSDQRNFGILNAKSSWVLYLDADERLTEPFKRELVQVIEHYDEFSQYGGYFVNRKTFYFGKDWHFQDKVQRLFKRDRFIEWKGVVHETPYIKGDFGQIKAPIIHLTHRNLSQMIRKTNVWSEYEANLRIEHGHPKMVSWRFLRVMFTEFFQSYVKKRGYKNGTYGLIEAMYQAFSIFITYAKLWEMQNKQK